MRARMKRMSYKRWKKCFTLTCSKIDETGRSRLNKQVRYSKTNAASLLSYVDINKQTRPKTQPYNCRMESGDRKRWGRVKFDLSGN